MDMLSTKLLIKQMQSPGDILMLTSAIRDLKNAYPAIRVNALTPCPEIWEHNPYLDRSIGEWNADKVIQGEYKHEINRSTQRGFHFSRAFTDNIAEQLGVNIPVVGHGPDVFFTDKELHGDDFGDYWILNAGGKHDYTAKWWNPDHYQTVVDHFSGHIQFMQVGLKDHYHPDLKGVINMVGKTTLRQLMVHAKRARGIITPVSFLMHLTGNMMGKDDGLIPTIVLAGGREGMGWVGYTGQHYLSRVGMYKCCKSGPCWKSKATKSQCEQEIKEGKKIESKNLCEYTVDLNREIQCPNGMVRLEIPKCMDDTSPKEVIDIIERIYSERYS